MDRASQPDSSKSQERHNQSSGISGNDNGDDRKMSPLTERSNPKATSPGAARDLSKLSLSGPSGEPYRKRPAVNETDTAAAEKRRRLEAQLENPTKPVCDDTREPSTKMAVQRASSPSLYVHSEKLQQHYGTQPHVENMASTFQARRAYLGGQWRPPSLVALANPGVDSDDFSQEEDTYSSPLTDYTGPQAEGAEDEEDDDIPEENIENAGSFSGLSDADASNQSQNTSASDIALLEATINRTQAMLADVRAARQQHHPFDPGEGSSSRPEEQNSDNSES